MIESQGAAESVSTLPPKERFASSEGISSSNLGLIHQFFIVEDSATSSPADLYGRTDPTTGDLRISVLEPSRVALLPTDAVSITADASTATEDYILGLQTQIAGASQGRAEESIAAVHTDYFTRRTSPSADESIHQTKRPWFARVPKCAMAPLVTLSLMLMATQPSTADPFFGTISTLRSRRRSFQGEDPTSITAPIVSIEEQAFRCFQDLNSEEFQDGMTDFLGDRIQRFISSNGSAAIDALSSLIFSGRIADEAQTHTLRWLARIDSPATVRSRLWLLRFSLLSVSSIVRDGALLGLAILQNPLAIPDLRSAMEKELFPGLRRDMLRVLERLEPGQ